MGYSAQAGAYFAALQRLDAALLSLLLYTFPAMVTVAAIALGPRAGQPPQGRRARRSPRPASSSCWPAPAPGRSIRSGRCSGVTAAVVYTTYILTSAGVAERVGPLLLSALVCTGAATTLTLATVFEGDLHLGAVSAAGFGWLAGIAVVSTVGAVSLFFAGLKRVGPTTASILSTAEPVTTVVLAFLAFGESLGPVQLAGGALVLGAVLVLSVRPAGSRDARVCLIRPLQGQGGARHGRDARRRARHRRRAGRGGRDGLLHRAHHARAPLGVRPARDDRGDGRARRRRRRARDRRRGRPPASPTQVRALVARIDDEQGRLDVLVNDIWGGEKLAEWNTPIWEHDLDGGLRMLRLAIDTHLITSHFALPLLIRRPGGLRGRDDRRHARVQRAHLPAVDLLRPGQGVGAAARVRAGPRARGRTAAPPSR